MAGGNFLALAQNSLARIQIIIIDFLRPDHRGIREAQNRRVKFQHIIKIDVISFIVKGNGMFFCAGKMMDNDACQTLFTFNAH